MADIQQVSLGEAVSVNVAEFTEDTADMSSST